MTVGTVADVLTLPETAVTTQDGVSTVRLTRGTVVTTQAVQTGRQFAGRVEITSGLSEGDLVQAPRGVVVTSPPPPQYGPPRTTPSR